MANGQQKAQENVQAFIAWSATMRDSEYRQIVFRGNLNRAEVAKGCGFAKSALRQNPQVKALLDGLENDLRHRGVLPYIDSQNKAPASKYDRTASKRSRDAERVSRLEQENLELKARLRRYEELSEVIAELGIDV